MSALSASELNAKRQHDVWRHLLSPLHISCLFVVEAERLAAELAAKEAERLAAEAV